MAALFFAVAALCMAVTDHPTTMWAFLGIGVMVMVITEIANS